MIKFQILIFAFILLTQRIEAENPWPRFVASKMTERVINTVWKESESVEMINRNLTPIKLDLPSVAELELNNFAIESLKKILFEKKFFDYAPMCGLEEARQAIVDHFKSEEDNFTRHDVFLTTGASHALQLAIQAIANPGDNILVPNPGWQYYRTLCKANLIEVHQYKINFKRSQESEFNMEQMRNQINEKTRAILINNPSNPHGVVFSQQQLEKVLKLAEELKLPIISDETFQGMIFNPERVKFHPLTSLEPKVPIITCDGIGKRYLLPGWRLGWLIVHNRFNALTNVRQGIWRLSQIINGPSTMGQGALVQTLNKTPPEFFTHTNKVLAENAKHFAECLSGIPGFKPFPPQAGWFIVHLLDGEIFGMHNWVRIALIVPKDVIEEACNRIEKLSAKYMIGPTVNTKQGKVKGFYTQDKVTNVFLGIPYAKPPVGELRFEKPEPPSDRNELLPTIKHRKTCHIFAEPDWLTTLLYDQDDNRKQSEDCLYLNIFAPRQLKNKRNKKLYPVMFIIHGGGFEMGSSTQYSIYDDISQTFVKHGILVVSIQYRLGQLGFASTGDKVLPGNLGLWDQLEALKWVKANIANFGGDPDEITLFGHSAGSGSVSAHSISPHSRNLFKRAIQMSGSSFTNWIYGSRVAPESKKLTKALGCKGDSMAIKKCLKKVTPDQIKQTQMDIGTTRNEPMPGLYQPRFDGDFFPEEVPLLAAKAKPKPTLMSFTKLESESFTLVTNPPNGANSTLFETGLKWDELDGYGLADLSRFIKEHVAYPERFGEVASTVAEEILAFFTSDERKTEKNADYFHLHQYVQLCSDLLFSMGSLLEAKMKASKDWPIYLLQSNFVNDAAFPKEIKIHETYHAYDLDYVFHNPKMPFKFNEADLKIQAFMQEAMRNFVKTGNPSAQQITWPKISKSGPNFQHIEMIVSGPIVRENMAEEQKRLAFWKAFSKKYPQYDLLFECPRDEKWMGILG